MRGKGRGFVRDIKQLKGKREEGTKKRPGAEIHAERKVVKGRTRETWGYKQGEAHVCWRITPHPSWRLEAAISPRRKNKESKRGE